MKLGPKGKGGNMFKKKFRLIGVLMLSFVILFSASVPTFAQNVDGVNDQVSTLDIERYKNIIYTNEGIIIDDDQIIDVVIEDGVVTLSVETTMGFDAYVFGLEGETGPSARIDIIGIIMKIKNGTQWVCKLVTAISGSNVCAKVGLAILNSMVPDVQYKAVSYFYKNPNCQPQHSYQCNSGGNAYWKTTVVRV